MEIQVPGKAVLEKSYRSFTVMRSADGQVKIACTDGWVSKPLLHDLVEKIRKMNKHLYISGPITEKLVNGKLRASFSFKEKKFPTKNLSSKKPS